MVDQIQYPGAGSIGLLDRRLYSSIKYFDAIVMKYILEQPDESCPERQECNPTA